MSKSLSEFKRFLQKEQKNLSEFETKLARLILDDFRAVEILGTAGGRRGKKIADLILSKGDSVKAELNLEGEKSADDATKISHLSKITVGNFRGFSNEHTFDFKNRYTFIYGPNGTGKSSLCEVSHGA